ncbi:O-antigen polymerase [Bacillus sp. V5-8f]|uniref:O-antigen polymerase n=1 Tax=Bacillus sp. V5-8f TaxID=2053044 RepID=UPI0021559D0C|nr:O-antigen polymerase [Bacillus sp. V5-8f]
MQILFLLLLIVFSLTGILIHKKVLNLLTIFNLVWICIILLYGFQMSIYLTPFSNRTVIYFILVFSSFFLGYIYIFLFYLPKYKKGYLSAVPKRAIFLSKNFIENSFFVIFIILIVETIFSGGIPLIWLLTGSDKNYFDFGIPTLHGLLMSFILFYGTLLYFILNQNFRKKYLFYFLFICLIPILLISRQIAITLVVQILIIHHLSIKRINFIKGGSIALICIVLFGIAGNIRTGLDNFLNVAKMSNQNISYFESGFYWVYMYLTMSLANVNNLFTNISFDYTFGKNILSSFLPTIVTDVIYNAELSAPYFLVSPNFTVSSFMVTTFIDFGIVGLTIYTFLLGLISCIVYHNYIFNKSIRNMFVYATMLQILLMSFFVDFLLYLPVSFQFFWYYLFLRDNKTLNQKVLYNNFINIKKG